MVTEKTIGLQIARAQAGDPSTMRDIHSHQARGTHPIARTLDFPADDDCEGQGEGENQEALLKANQRLTLFRGRSNLATCVYAVVRKLTLEAERTRGTRQVPFTFRTAVALFELEGWICDEIAALEGVSVGTVKSRLSRGRNHLRQILSDMTHQTSNATEAVRTSRDKKRDRRRPRLTVANAGRNQEEKQ